MRGTPVSMLRPFGILSGIFLLLLAACDTTVPGRNFPEISFTDRPPINLDVAKIEVEKPPPVPAGERSVDYELPVSLRRTAERWARERLKAVGSQGTAVVKIEQAKVTEERLKKTGGIKGAFTTDQTERYHAVLSIAVSIDEPRRQAKVRAEGQRKRTVPEDATLAQREKLWFEMTEQLSREVDAELERQIRQHMTDFLR